MTKFAKELLETGIAAVVVMPIAYFAGRKLRKKTCKKDITNFKTGLVDILVEKEKESDKITERLEELRKTEKTCVDHDSWILDYESTLQEGIMKGGEIKALKEIINAKVN